MCRIINYGFNINGTFRSSGDTCNALLSDSINATTQWFWNDGTGIPPSGSNIYVQIFLYKDGVYLNGFSTQATTSGFTQIIEIPLTGVTWISGSNYVLDWTQVVYVADPLVDLCSASQVDVTGCTSVTISTCNKPTCGFNLS